MAEDISWLEEKIHGDGPPVIIDGGMGTELEKAGVPMDGKVWSGHAVLNHGDTVRRLHEDFIHAGAEVIIANTFATARHMLAPGGLGDKVHEINRAAVKLALEARDNAATGPMAVAGSICEWAPTEDNHWHDPVNVGKSSLEQAELLAEVGVDLIALEMCQSIEHSIAAIEAARSTGLPLWFGPSAKTHPNCDMLSVFDHADVPFEPLIEAMAKTPAMIMNIMHTPIQDIDESIAVIKKHWDGPFGVYPESGYFKMPHWQFVEIIEPDQLAEEAQSWVDQGARLLGGCCGLGTEHIRALREAFGE